jgi:hypothetical protein
MVLVRSSHFLSLVIIDVTDRKKIDPNMSSSRIKIPYSASSFSYAAHDVSFTTNSRTQHLTNKYQKDIHSHLQAVLDTCREIISLYLTSGSIHEVNLPITLIRSIKQEWKTLEDKLKKGIERETGSNVSLSEYHSLLHATSVVFSRAKHEVFMLLKDDNYARYNKTQEFENFISNMKPYA